MTATDKSGVEYDTLEQETSVLAMFKEIKNPNAKKVKKLAAKLALELPLEIQRCLCRDIYRAHDPIKYLNSSIDKINDCAILIKQFTEEGKHGMIFTGKYGTDIYPIQLDTRANWLEEGVRWDPEQEMIIAHEAVDSWMKDNNKGYFYGKVVLFPTFGFSGEPRVIEAACGDTTGMVKYPGTNFYVRPGTTIEPSSDMSQEFQRVAEKLANVSKARSPTLLFKEFVMRPPVKKKLINPCVMRTWS